MKIIIDQKYIQRNALIGKILRWTSLVCMVIGLVAVFSDDISSNPTLFFAFFFVMIIGVLLSSVSGFFTSRFGKNPRPDELIDKSLKGLDDRFRIFHYQTSIPHLLIGPAGNWSIVPTYVDGEIVFDERKGNWIHKKNSFLNRVLQKEYFPNPKSEYEHQKKEFNKLVSSTSEENGEEFNLLILLLHKNAKIIGDSEMNNILILPYEKAKDRFRKISKINKQTNEIFDVIEQKLAIKD